MTFEEWLLEQGFKHPEFDLMIKRSEYALMKAAWNAAIESAATKLARGTNLYNICGDHISGQVIDSITQLKSS